MNSCMVQKLMHYFSRHSISNYSILNVLFIMFICKLFGWGLRSWQTSADIYMNMFRNNSDLVHLVHMKYMYSGIIIAWFVLLAIIIRFSYLFSVSLENKNSQNGKCQTLFAYGHPEATISYPIYLAFHVINIRPPSTMVQQSDQSICLWEDYPGSLICLSISTCVLFRYNWLNICILV